MTTTVNTINGNEGNNRLTGGSRNDVINGNGGNDRLNGGSGDDTLNGGAGKDELNGGSGNDVLDGGSGSDELEGGSGNDRFIYTLGENNVKGTYDEYDGGSGSDTLELRFTRAEWMNEDNQKMLQSYLKWASKSGSGCRWDDDFTFKFGNARLEIEDIEKLVVKVDGATIKDLGISTVDAVDDAPEKSITEDVTDVQNIYFLRNDKVNYLVKDVKLEPSTTIGNVLLVKVDPDDTETWYFRYKPSDTFYQYLQSNMTEKDTFKYTVIDAKGNEDTATVTITITGISDEAKFSGDLEGKVEESNIEDTSTITGQIYAKDLDNPSDRFEDENDVRGEYGKFSITSGGLWIYTLYNKNESVDVLNKGQTLTDSFTIYSIDGTPQTITITIQGADDVVNSAPVVKELGQGENKYAGSANVEELINLKYDHPTIAEYVAKGGDYDYLHVRTGQFTFSDSDLTDTFKITSKAAGPQGNLGALTFDDYTNAKKSDGTIIDGEYIVKWTYTVKDRDLESLDATATGASSKDDDFIVTINDGTKTVDTKVLLNLFGRNEIEFVDGYNDGNNVYVDPSGSLGASSTSGNDVLYFGDGDDSFSISASSIQLIYGEDGDDRSVLNSGSHIVFGGNGNDSINLERVLIQGLVFGGDGNDDFNLAGKISTIQSNVARESFMWGGKESDVFKQNALSTTKINDWIMDFDGSNPNNGGDKIEFVDLLRFDASRFVLTPHVWKNDVNKTQLIKHEADSLHPFLSEGSIYYELQAKSSVNSTDTNWYSVLNLVGTNGTAITLDSLFANGNLNPIEIL